MDGGQRARARSLLRLVRAGAVAALGAGEDAARGEDEDVSVGELLLELAGESVTRVRLLELFVGFFFSSLLNGLGKVKGGGSWDGIEWFWGRWGRD